MNAPVLTSTPTGVKMTYEVKPGMTDIALQGYDMLYKAEDPMHQSWGFFLYKLCNLPLNGVVDFTYNKIEQAVCGSNSPFVPGRY